MAIFRKEFSLRAAIRQARIHICGLGYYEFRLNGRKVGNRLIEPGWSNYRRRVFFSTDDVAPYLREGVNVAGVMLGNGFFNLRGGGFHNYHNSFGAPQFIALLRVEYLDGVVDTWHTDRSWKWADGPIRFSNEFAGETFDCRAWPSGWDQPGFTPATPWTSAVEITGPGGKLRAQPIEPIVAHESLPLADVSETPEGDLLVDFGQNASAMPEITLRGASGQSVTMIPKEWKNPEGNIVNANMSESSECLYTYTLGSDKEETWSPRFTYYGYRWLLIRGARYQGKGRGPVELLRARSHVVYPHVAPAGHFQTSEPLLNRIEHIIHWAIVSNLKSVFTDCPHREKLGWLEESHLMAPSLMNHFHLENQFLKIQDDMVDHQTANGFIPNVCPEFIILEGEHWKEPFRDSPEWGSALILSAWDAYRRYGRADLITRNYPAMKKYFDYLESRAVKGGLLLHGLSDWLDVGALKGEWITPMGVTATCVFYQNAITLEQMARRLGHEDDARHFASRAAQIARVFHAEFHNSDAGCYGVGEYRAPSFGAWPDNTQAWTFASGSQTSQAMPLILGMVPEDCRAKVFSALVRDFESRGCRMTGGDVGSVYILRALAAGGRNDLILKMCRHTDHPSYGFQIARGATTLTENWDGPISGNSQNHFMLGHIDEWFHRELGGIRFDLTAPDILVLKPCFADTLDHVDCSYESIYGQIASSWKRVAGQIAWTVVIPSGLRARIEFPDGKVIASQKAGKHEFVWSPRP